MEACAADKGTSAAELNCGVGLSCRSVITAGELDSCASQHDIDAEGQFIPPIFLQHSFDCVAVRFAGAMHAIKGAAKPSKITKPIKAEAHRRIAEFYPDLILSAVMLITLLEQLLNGADILYSTEKASLYPDRCRASCYLFFFNSHMTGKPEVILPNSRFVENPSTPNTGAPGWGLATMTMLSSSPSASMAKSC